MEIRCKLKVGFERKTTEPAEDWVSVGRKRKKLGVIPRLVP